MKFLAIFAILSCVAIIPASDVFAAEVPPRVLELPMQGYAGHFREHCIALQAGQSLTLSVDSPYAVRLNVHHHNATGTVFLVDEIVDGPASNAVDIPSDGEYCLEVTNPESRPSAFELRLEYRVSAG